MNLYTLLEETILDEGEKARALDGLDNNYIAFTQSTTYETVKDLLEMNGYAIKETKYLVGEFVIFLA